MNGSEDTLLRGHLRATQIIAGALLAGVLIFLAVALVLVANRGGAGMAAAGNLPPVSILAVGLLVVQAPLAFILPAILTRTALPQIAAGTWQPSPKAHAA